MLRGDVAAVIEAGENGHTGGVALLGGDGRAGHAADARAGTAYVAGVVAAHHADDRAIGDEVADHAAGAGAGSDIGGVIALADVGAGGIARHAADLLLLGRSDGAGVGAVVDGAVDHLAHNAAGGGGIVLVVHAVNGDADAAVDVLNVRVQRAAHDAADIVGRRLHDTLHVQVLDPGLLGGGALEIAEQALIAAARSHEQVGDGVAVAVERAGEGVGLRADGGPGLAVEVDVLIEEDGGEGAAAVYLLGEPRQLLGGGDVHARVVELLRLADGLAVPAVGLADGLERVDGAAQCRGLRVDLLLRGGGVIKHGLRRGDGIGELLIALGGVERGVDGLRVAQRLREGICAELAQTVDGGLELQRHGLLLGVSVLDEIQHGLGVEAGAVEVKHALGPDVLELRVYLAVGGVERGHGGLGIALGVDLAGLPEHVLHVRLGVVDLRQARPVDLHAGILVTGGGGDVEHHGHEHVAEGGVVVGVVRSLGGRRLIGIGGHHGRDVNREQVAVGLVDDVEVARLTAEAGGTELLTVELILGIGVVVAIIDDLARLRLLIGQRLRGGEDGLGVACVRHAVAREAAGVDTLQLHHEAIHTEVAHRHELDERGGLAVLNDDDRTIRRVIGPLGLVAVAAAQGGVAHGVLLGIAGVAHVDVGVVDAVGHVGGYAEVDGRPSLVRRIRECGDADQIQAHQHCHQQRQTPPKQTVCGFGHV